MVEIWFSQLSTKSVTLNIRLWMRESGEKLRGDYFEPIKVAPTPYNLKSTSSIGYKQTS